MATLLALVAGTLVVLGGVLYQPVSHRLTVLGVTRPDASIQNVHGVQELIQISNTAHCEDLHYHAASDKLYTACESSAAQRTRWFPPLAIFNDSNVGQGKLVVVDPKTFTSTELTLSGFQGPFITHGIDLFPSPDEQTLTIFAVNHLPNPEHFTEKRPRSPFPGRSQIEVFTHDVGSSTATHVRSIRHEDIRTPNDIVATSPTSFYVTNDHIYRGKIFWRDFEDLLEYNTAAWSNVVHVSFEPNAPHPAAGVEVTEALGRMHNPNGLGHSSPARPNEILLVDASGGELYTLERNLAPGASPALTLRDRIQFDTTLDNPSYYDDPYATPSSNASGVVIAGLLKAHSLVDDVEKGVPIPTVVWHLKSFEQGEQPKMLFQDDGKQLSSASAAVIVGIDPSTNGGKRQGWLFVTGFVSEAMVAAKVDL